MLRNHYELCNNINDCLVKIKYNDKIAVSVSREHAMNNLEILKSELFCFTKSNNVYSYSVTMLAKKNFHLLSRMNTIIRQIVEFGLIQKWEKQDYTVMQIRLEQNQPINNLDNNLIVLTVGHIGGALIIMFVGWIFGILSFIVEILINTKLAKRRYFRHMTKYLDAFVNPDRYFLK